MRKEVESDEKALNKINSIIEDWQRTLPREFTLGTVNGNGRSSQHRYPDLHFKADESVPGLYYAQLDPRALSNGNGNGRRATRIEVTNDTKPIEFDQAKGE